MAGAHDLYINQGESWRQGFQWLLAKGEPVDLSGYAGRCQIRRAPGNPLTASVPVTVEDAAAGKFFVELTAEETAGIPAFGKGYDKREKYTYDIELCTSGETYRVLNGYLYVSPEVSK